MDWFLDGVWSIFGLFPEVMAFTELFLWLSEKSRRSQIHVSKSPNLSFTKLWWFQGSMRQLRQGHHPVRFLDCLLSLRLQCQDHVWTGIVWCISDVPGNLGWYGFTGDIQSIALPYGCCPESVEALRACGRLDRRCLLKFPRLYRNGRRCLGGGGVREKNAATRFSMLRFEVCSAIPCSDSYECPWSESTPLLDHWLADPDSADPAHLSVQVCQPR